MSELRPHASRCGVVAGVGGGSGTPVHTHLQPLPAASKSHRFDVLEQQLSTTGPSGMDPLPATVSHDLMRITRRMAQDPELVSRMSAIVAEECAASRSHWQYCPSAQPLMDGSTSQHPTQSPFHRVASLDASGASGFDVVDTPPRSQGHGSPFAAVAVGGSVQRARAARTCSMSSFASETPRHSKQPSNAAGFDSCDEYEEFERIFSMNFTRIGSAHPPAQVGPGLGAPTVIGGRRAITTSESQGSLCTTIQENSVDLSAEGDALAEEGGEEQSSDHSTTDSPAYHCPPAATCAPALPPPVPPLPLSRLEPQDPPRGYRGAEGDQRRPIVPTTTDLVVKAAPPTNRLSTATKLLGVAMGSAGTAGHKVATAVFTAIQSIWNATCTVCGFDLRILPQPLSVAIEDVSGGERESHSSRKAIEKEAVPSTRIAAAIVPATLDLPRRLGFHRRRSADRSTAALVPHDPDATRAKIDQRFMLAAGMLINASIMWALTNRIRPSRVFGPVVELIQTAFFSSIF